MYYSTRLKRAHFTAALVFLLFVCISFLRVRALRQPQVCEPDVFTKGTLPVNIQAKPEQSDTAHYIYLTFDDGPSATTETVLDTLKEYGVHATFFVVTNQTDDYHHLFQRMLDEGHTIALHSHTHSYSSVYKTPDAFFEDLATEADIIYDICGIRPTIFRFPGGSSNTVCKRHGGASIMRELLSGANARGLTYVDWNVSAEDTTGTRYSAQRIAQRVISGIGERTQSVVLMHDTARTITTAQALPEIIETFLEQGYIFDTVDNLEQPVQHIKQDDAEPVQTD